MRLMNLLLCTAGLAWSAASDKLVWSDEFDYVGLPAANKWDYDVGGWGWGNQELQYYTASRPSNAWVDSGFLRINVRLEDTTWSDGAGTPTTNHLTSARLVTRGKASWTYGRFETRMKLPRGRGMWPAFWMLPDLPNPYGDWPKSGEIDVLENFGFEPTLMHGSIQLQDSHGANSLGAQTLTEYPADSFHVYSADWRPGSIVLSIDGTPYFRYANPRTGSAQWPFDKPLHMILNVAVNGAWGDTLRTQTSGLPQSLVVDWVRVWQDTTLGGACCTLAVAQSLGGTIAATPSKSVYAPGEKIAIQAIAAPGNSFSHWNGATKSLRWEDTLYIDANTTLSAVFSPSSERLANGAFDQGWTQWRLWNDSTLHPTYLLRDGMGCVSPATATSETWHVQIAHGSFPAAVGDRFEISFVTRAANSRPIDFRLSQAHEPYAAITATARLALDSGRQFHRELLDAQWADPEVRIELNLAASPTEICFDSVSVKKLGETTTGVAASSSRTIVALVGQSGGRLNLTSDESLRWSVTTTDGACLGRGRSAGRGMVSLCMAPRGVALVNLEAGDGTRRTLRVIGR